MHILTLKTTLMLHYSFKLSIFVREWLKTEYEHGQSYAISGGF